MHSLDIPGRKTAVLTFLLKVQGSPRLTSPALAAQYKWLGIAVGRHGFCLSAVSPEKTA